MSYLWLPIGSYSANRPLNAGGNRWQNPMRLAGSQALGHSFIGETSFDAQFNGDNEQYTVALRCPKGRSTTYRDFCATSLWWRTDARLPSPDIKLLYVSLPFATPQLPMPKHDGYSKNTKFK
jgi:hypothetical protein